MNTLPEKDCCARCGKSLLIRKDERSPKTNIPDKVTGCIASLGTVPQDDECYNKYLKRQLGKYEIGKTYEFCFECWLDSLMGV